MIHGPSATEPGKDTFGTVFFVGKRLQGSTTEAANVLVTAAHVLDGIAGDTATLLLRRRNSDGTYVPFDFNIRIRKNGLPLYVKHDRMDVAAMYVPLPRDAPVTLADAATYLADDSLIDSLQLHPGDQVFFLGFPLAASGPGGFPLLRQGLLASYPLTPVHTVREWVLDAQLFGGNSGGPVYFYYGARIYDGAMHLGGRDRGILGLVIEQVNSALPEFKDKPLNYGVIVPAEFIRETIDKLPAPPPVFLR